MGPKFRHWILGALNALWFSVLPVGAFFAGYRCTDRYFRERSIPFPSERYGLAVAFACFFWALGFLIIIRRLSQKRRSSP